MQSKSKSKQGLSLLWKFSQGFRGWALFAAVMTVLAVLLDYMMPQVVRIIVDSVIDTQPFALPGFVVGWIEALGGRDYLQEHLLLCASVAVAASVSSALCNFLRRTSMAVAAEGMISKMRDALFFHIQRLPYRWHIENQTGDTIQRCTSDVEVIRSFLSTQMIDMVRTVVLIVVSMLLMFSMNGKLSLIALCFIPVTMLSTAVFYREISKRFRIADEAEGRLSANVQENLTGVRVIRAFGRQRYEIDRFDEKNEEFANYWIKLSCLMGVYWGSGNLLCMLQVMVIIVAGTMEAVAGAITLGEFLVFITYNSMLVWPVRALGRILSELGKMNVSLERIKEILDAEEERDDPKGLEPDMKQDIVFDHVSFRYEGAAPVLDDVSFTIKAGSTLGILGGTGSGKSTLTYLLDRLYDLPEGCGSISIGGVELKAMKLSYLRSNIGLVLQEPFLFSKTIKENIGATLRHGEDMERIRKAASVAAVDEAIEEFAEGYDTVVGERGVTLSGGQKQRVAIARMLMQQAPIMIFDDSLSAVDTETDAKIRRALRDNTGSSTVILISHRIATLQKADKIIVLDKGKVVQQGTHEELIAREGIYRQIYQIQGADGSHADIPEGGVLHG